MSGEIHDAALELHAMRERVRDNRTHLCEPQSNANPRYLALSDVVSNLTKAIEDLEAEADLGRLALVMSGTSCAPPGLDLPHGPATS
jgi:hypothetical protein